MSDKLQEIKEEVETVILHGGKWLPLKIDTARWLIEQLEQERAKTKVELWICPDCGFGFDAGHTDVSTGEHSCPCCSELELEKQLEQAQATNQKLVKGLAWYGQKTIYETDVLNQWAPIKPILVDCGERARKLLIEVKGND